jgi:hypothetical protein
MRVNSAAHPLKRASHTALHEQSFEDALRQADQALYLAALPRIASIRTLFNMGQAPRVILA